MDNVYSEVRGTQEKKKKTIEKSLRKSRVFKC